MNWSLGEFESLAKKAIRGAGYSWGLAEEGARAARGIAALGLPADDLLATLLMRTDGKSYADLQPGAPLCCPLCLGPTLCDILPTEPVKFQNVAVPLFLLPYLRAALAGKTGGFHLTWPGASIHIGDTGFVAMGPALQKDAEELTLIPEPAPMAKPQMHSRITLSTSAEQTLLNLAHRTYAPATEASRLAGAGAGLSDND